MNAAQYQDEESKFFAVGVRSKMITYILKNVWKILQGRFREKNVWKILQGRFREPS